MSKMNTFDDNRSRSVCKEPLNRRLMISLLALLMPLSILAQDIMVQGVVKDQTGESVIGATVMQKGTNNGTVTDFDGKFSLNVSSKATLVFSYIGYVTQEVAVNGKRFIHCIHGNDK